jgi:CTP synthase
MLLEYGVQPDVLVCRTEKPLSKDIRKKVALFCNVEADAVIESIDADSIYQVPLLMKEEKLDEVVLRKVGIPFEGKPDLSSWVKFIRKLKNPGREVSVALVGKYIELKDAYKSISEAIIHAGVTNDCKVNVRWVHSEQVSDDNLEELFSTVSGILVAPGFGERGIEGKIAAIRYAREKEIPFFGICLGMQCAVVEFARNVLGLKAAHSIEMKPDTPHPVIDLMETQKKVTTKGGTMRLGAYPCSIKENSLAEKIYKTNEIRERHRHRYEFNNNYLQDFNKAGMVTSGINPKTGLVEIVELKNHPFFIGVQFHPEYKSTVAHPQPIFVAFIQAALKAAKKS